MKKVHLVIILIVIILGCTITYYAGYNNGMTKEKINDEINGTYHYRNSMIYMTIDENKKRLFLLDQNHQVFKKTVFKKKYKRLDASTYYFKDDTLGQCYVYFAKDGIKVIISKPEAMVMHFKRVGNVPTYWHNYFKYED